MLGRDLVAKRIMNSTNTKKKMGSASIASTAARDFAVQDTMPGKASVGTNGRGTHESISLSGHKLYSPSNNARVAR